jgi:SAM-dependent methyltransferase
MNICVLRSILGVALVGMAVSPGWAQEAASKPFEPYSGQPGKDVVWVPTPEETVEKMLDIAKVTPQDFVMDLGSGDGRNVIAAAKRGARGVGVEYNPDMVALSKRRAKEAGVDGKAEFVEGDMYVADISRASVMALFLLPQNMDKLKDKFLGLKPGSRIVSNTFSFGGENDWEPDYTETVPNCSSWCTVLLWVVPAKVDGAWNTPQGRMTVTQEYQHFTGSLGSTPIADGKVTGESISFVAGPTTITAKLSGNTLEGTAVTNGKSVPWKATR